MTTNNCNCEQHAPAGFLTSGFRHDGERWTCPNCGKEWMHYCGEDEGCCWFETKTNEAKA